MRCSRKVITNDPYRVKTMRLWQFDDEVHGDGVPGPIGDIERLEQVIWLVPGGFDAGTGVTSRDILTNKSAHTGP
ncbi:uncharacterized protein LAESUDRAFT_663667 [Laetiporus sulphureus 93-53]|uniref:Uncharacterized protein n=1 Tax=Laetiporus sulphureus 93-53 TaxID=1314785 RepID=A0A165BSQ5_9APHY|nr:uncharacterized protein LAESUDRAFT_663667 [Laetiporus sulphureus 93-53]KZT01579.1 hypothetical protein LAESUDRAFT_663667 [Laetiporus sulphureus 93-53]